MNKFFVYFMSLNLMMVAYQSIANANELKLNNYANTGIIDTELSEQCLKLINNRSILLARATNGDASAQYCVGKTFLPNVFKQDDPNWACRNEDEALNWISKAAKKGVVDAIYFKAGLLYSKDIDQSIQLFLQAAEAGHTLSMYFIGSALSDGIGVPKNEVQALMWLNIAASRKSFLRNSIAIHRDYVEKRLSRDEVAAAQKLSSSWKPKIKQGNLSFQVQEVLCE
jgi:hypothetical protein